MKSLVSAGVALAALFAFATPSQAAISGAYLVTFSSNGRTQCLVLTENGALGIPKSGTWTSTTYANWGGTFEILKGRMLHLVGPYGSPVAGYTTFDGTVSPSMKTLINSSYNEFDTTGVLIDAGSVGVVKQAGNTCAASQSQSHGSTP